MIVIVTDSTAGMTHQEARELGAMVVPMTYTVAGNLHTETYLNADVSYIDEIAATQDLRTSQAAIGEYLATFTHLRRKGYEVLCLAISSRLSGTFSNATFCAKELGKEGIRVVDTRTTAGGLLLMVRAARRLIDAGFSLEETARKIEAMRDAVNIRFSVEDMTPLRRSGRLGPVRQSVGTILNIRPILTCRKGSVVACGMVRGRNEQLRTLVNAVPEDAHEVLVEYIKDKEGARNMAQRLEQRLKRTVELRRVGPVLGIHLGLDAIGVIWREDEKPTV